MEMVSYGENIHDCDINKMEFNSTPLVHLISTSDF